MTVWRRLSIRGYRSIVKADLKLGTITAIVGRSDSGKCLGRGTPVMFADGTVRAVESVFDGDLLLGPDGHPRRVRTTTRGRGPLFRIVPRKGEPWICNDAHLLTVEERDGSLIDLTVVDWLGRSPRWRAERKLATRAVERFPTSGMAPPPIDPYFLGVWFGDGSKATTPLSRQGGREALAHVAITNPDREILEAIGRVATEWGLKTTTYDVDRCPTVYLRTRRRGGENPLLDTMRRLLGPELKIPDCIMRGDIEVRRRFLAGFLDADGYLGSNCFDIAQKREDWARGVWWIARSIGLTSTIRPKSSTNQDGYEGDYWRVSISGETDSIPTRIPRKQASPRSSNRGARRTGFEVEAIGEGDYFGFSLDGDGRFLLGDFTITHNSNVIRALRDWAFNAGGVGFQTVGKDVTRVAVAIGDRTKVVWEKRKMAKRGGASRYLVSVIDDGEETRESYEKIGVSVPDDVIELTGIRPLQVDDYSFGINFAEQDERWFLIANPPWTPGKVARVVGQVSGVDALLFADRDLARARAIEAKKAKGAHELVEKKMSEKSELDDGLSSLGEILDRAREVADAIESDKSTLARATKLFRDLSSIRARLRAVKEFRVAAEKAVEVYETRLEVDLSALGEAAKVSRGVSDLRAKLADREKSERELRDKVKEVAREMEGWIETELDECPVCGGDAHPECVANLRKQAEEMGR